MQGFSTSLRSPSEAQTAPAPRRVVDIRLHANVHERESGAHLDEMALVANLMRPERRPGSVMIDVGAHHGSAYRRFRDAGWTILAFEPDPRHADFLEARLVGDDGVVLDRRAVSNVTGEKVTFFVSEESIGISGLSAFRESHVPIGEVETVALRDVPEMTRADLLKIDTEGYELFVLEGFPWERVRPGVIVAEFEDNKSVRLGYNTQDLVRFLRERDYQVWVSEWHPIVRYGITHQWRRMFDSADDEPDPTSWGNLIAFAEPVSSAALGRQLAKVLTFAPVSGS